MTAEIEFVGRKALPEGERHTTRNASMAPMNWRMAEALASVRDVTMSRLLADLVKSSASAELPLDRLARLERDSAR